MAVSAGLLYLALRLTDFQALYARLSRLDAFWTLAGLAVLLLQIGMGAVRWRIIASRCDAAMTFAQSLRFMMIAMFFNQALPSTVGGDAMRIWLLSRLAHLRNATYSVLVDRAAGLIWLAVIVLVCLPWSLQLITNVVGRIALVLVGAIGVVGPLALIAATSIGRGFLKRWRLTRHFLDLASTLAKILAPSRAAFAVGVLSVAVHLMTVLFMWIAAKGIAAPLTLTQALLLVPPVILVSAVPISIGGWGVREGAMVTAFSYAALSQDDAFAVSLLFGTGTLVLGLVGGLIWIANRNTRGSGGSDRKEAAVNDAT